MDERAKNAASQERWQLDEQLSATGLVLQELIERFQGAYTYGTATPMQWLEGRLRVLRRRLEAGSAISVYDPGAGGLRSCPSVAEFASWVSLYLPEARIHGGDR